MTTNPANLIQPLPVERDSDGYWFHIGVPNFDEGEDEQYKAWLKSQGLATKFKKLEGEDDTHPVPKPGHRRPRRAFRDGGTSRPSLQRITGTLFMSKTTLHRILQLIANDAYAASFQSMGQYRTALLKAAKNSEPISPLPDLMPVILWLENGCDPKEAAKELRIYRDRAHFSRPAAPAVKDSVTAHEPIPIREVIAPNLLTNLSGL